MGSGMPTNRKRRTRNHRNSCPRCIWHSLIDDPLKSDDPDYNPFLISLGGSFWEKHKDEVLAFWIPNYPGTRPSIFWRVEVPLPRPKTQKEKLLYLKNNDLLTEYEQKTLKNPQKMGKKKVK